MELKIPPKRINSSWYVHKAIIYLNKPIELISTASLYLGLLAVLQLRIHCIGQVNKAACGEPVIVVNETRR